MKRTSVNLPEPLHARAQRRARKEGISFSEIVRDALTAHLAAGDVPARRTRVVLRDLPDRPRKLAPRDLAEKSGRYLRELRTRR